MKEMKEKIKHEIYSKKIVILIVLTAFLLGLLFGSIYITVLDNENKKEIITSVKNYFYSFNKITFSSKLEIFKNSLFKNMLYFIGMWALGLSIIGIPIIIIMVFIRSFMLGFSVSGIIVSYKMKGLLGLIMYIIPSNIIMLCLSIFLGIYTINLSIKLGTNAFGKKTLNFGTFMGRYFFILLVIILLCIITSLFDAFISPSLFKLFINFIK